MAASRVCLRKQMSTIFRFSSFSETLFRNLYFHRIQRTSFGLNSVEKIDDIDESKRKHHLNKNKVFIGSKVFNHDADYLKDVFSKFGDVSSVYVPNRNIYDIEPQKQGEFRFGFVTFQDETSYENAMKAGVARDNNIVFSIKDADGGKVRYSTNKPGNKPALNTVAINNLPNSIKIGDIRNHFESFGEIDFINLVYNGIVRSTGEIVNFAFVTFKSGTNMDNILNSVHTLQSVDYTAGKVDPRMKHRVDKCCAILVLDVPDSECTEQIMKEYFSQFGEVIKVNVLKDDTRKNEGKVFVSFTSQDTAHAAEEKDHVFGGQTVTVRALAWLNNNLI